MDEITQQLETGSEKYTTYEELESFLQEIENKSSELTVNLYYLSQESNTTVDQLVGSTLIWLNEIVEKLVNTNLDYENDAIEKIKSRISNSLGNILKTISPNVDSRFAFLLYNIYSNLTYKPDKTSFIHIKEITKHLLAKIKFHPILNDIVHDLVYWTPNSSLNHTLSSIKAIGSPRTVLIFYEKINKSPLGKHILNNWKAKLQVRDLLIKLADESILNELKDILPKLLENLGEEKDFFIDIIFKIFLKFNYPQAEQFAVEFLSQDSFLVILEAHGVTLINYLGKLGNRKETLEILTSKIKQHKSHFPNLKLILKSILNISSRINSEIFVQNLELVINLITKEGFEDYTRREIYEYIIVNNFEKIPLDKNQIETLLEESVKKRNLILIELILTIIKKFKLSTEKSLDLFFSILHLSIPDRNELPLTGEFALDLITNAGNLEQIENLLDLLDNKPEFQVWDVYKYIFKTLGEQSQVSTENLSLLSDILERGELPGDREKLQISINDLMDLHKIAKRFFGIFKLNRETFYKIYKEKSFEDVIIGLAPVGIKIQYFTRKLDQTTRGSKDETDTRYNLIHLMNSRPLETEATIKELLQQENIPFSLRTEEILKSILDPFTGERYKLN